MNVTILGAGYVGLIVGASLSAVGHRVVGYDVDVAKLQQLAEGSASMYEPGLDELVAAEVKSGRLRFTSRLVDAVQHGDVVFICVPTPAGADGAADLSAVSEVATGIGDAIEAEGRESRKLVVVKSTVPVGTSDFVESIIASRTTRDFLVASNPEFFREGSALRDFHQPARVIIGADRVGADRVRTVLRRLYDAFLEEDSAILVMDRRSAELTKYATNAMLALRIAFMNELASISEATGADIESVRRGVGSDPRIGPRFLKAGIGFGGSCMPKDLEALIGVGREYCTDAPLLTATHEANAAQWQRLLEKLDEHYEGDLASRTLAIWGATYKPRTSDVRGSPAMRIIEALLEAGASLRIYDPSGAAGLVERFGDRVELAADEYEALDTADGLAVLTDWNQFKNPDFDQIRTRMTQPVVFDGRNLYARDTLAEHGLLHYAIGKMDPDRIQIVEALAAGHETN